jgi:hypothetical protein
MKVSKLPLTIALVILGVVTVIASFIFFIVSSSHTAPFIVLFGGLIILLVGLFMIPRN